MAPHKLTKKQLAEQRAKQHADREARTQYDNDLQVMTIPQTAALDQVSPITLLRQIKNGTGPRTIQLSARRIGIRVRDYRERQESRIRSA
jgi:hypothetical protein